VLNEIAVRTPIRRNTLVERQPVQAEPVHELPAVPALPETLLLLELMVQEPSVDLRAMSELVLADVGAALQILRLAGREYGNAEGRPQRIVDCISDMGLEACMKAVSAKTVTRDTRQHAIAGFWEHARTIAQHARMVAEEMSEVDPEEAYLAGLFHSIGLLPGLLEWREAGMADGTLGGLRFAKRWSLPHCVTEFFTEMHLTGYATRWSGIVHKAHQLATRSSFRCPFEQAMGPQLHKGEYVRPIAVNFR
jgi:HD-like signal output (HDOD) protein